MAGESSNHLEHHINALCTFIVRWLSSDDGSPHHITKIDSRRTMSKYSPCGYIPSSECQHADIGKQNLVLYHGVIRAHLSCKPRAPIQSSSRLSESSSSSFSCSNSSGSDRRFATMQRDDLTLTIPSFEKCNCLSKA